MLIALKANGTLRFGEIHRCLGDVSQRMLAVTLRDLEADGLLVREVFPQVPPRVEYRLSRAGNRRCRTSKHWWIGPCRIFRTFCRIAVVMLKNPGIKLCFPLGTALAFSYLWLRPR